MSVWTHFTGSFGIDGLIFEAGRWDTIGNEISRLVTPLPNDAGRSNEPAYKIKLHDRSCLHFADVLASGDLRHAGSLRVIEDWLLMIMRRLKEKDWEIRCGCFYAYVEGQSPAIYYYDVYDDSDDTLYSWKKIKNVSGAALKTGS